MLNSLIAASLMVSQTPDLIAAKNIEFNKIEIINPKTLNKNNKPGIPLPKPKVPSHPKVKGLLFCNITGFDIMVGQKRATSLPLAMICSEDYQKSLKYKSRIEYQLLSKKPVEKTNCSSLEVGMTVNGLGGPTGRTFQFCPFDKNVQTEDYLPKLDIQTIYTPAAVPGFNLDVEPALPVKD